LVIKHFTMDYHEFSIYYGILFYNFPRKRRVLLQKNALFQGRKVQ